MASQAKFITSHSFRVKRANEYRKNSPKNISIIDREAIVEFYLLEDVVRQYEYNLKQAKDGLEQAQSRAGKMAMNSNIEKFSAIIDIFNSAIEVAQAQIISDNYKAVWKSIPEHALMVAAGNMKYISRLRDIAKELLKDLMEEALTASGIKMSFDEYLDKASAHDENVRAVRGLPSPDDLKGVVDALDVIPEVTASTKSKLRPNIN